MKAAAFLRRLPVVGSILPTVSIPPCSGTTGECSADSITRARGQKKVSCSAIAIGGGIEWRRPFLTVEADGWANTGTLHRGGASLNAEWIPTDELNFSVNAELFSMDTPLRALIHGITANKLGFGMGYDWHESTGLAVSMSALDFSDGNRRAHGWSSVRAEGL